MLPSAEPQPLLDVAQQWLALQLTCKAWAAALQAAPPLPLAVAVCLPPPSSAGWLQEHAAVLHLVAPPHDDSQFQRPSPAGAGRRMLDWVQRRCGLPHRGAVLWSPIDERQRGDPPGLVALDCCWEWRYAFFDLFLDGNTKTPPQYFAHLGIPDGAPLLALPACHNLQACAWASGALPVMLLHSAFGCHTLITAVLFRSCTWRPQTIPWPIAGSRRLTQR